MRCNWSQANLILVGSDSEVRIWCGFSGSPPGKLGKQFTYLAVWGIQWISHFLKSWKLVYKCSQSPQITDMGAKAQSHQVSDPKLGAKLWIIRTPLCACPLGCAPTPGGSLDRYSSIASWNARECLESVGSIPSLLMRIQTSCLGSMGIWLFL